MIRVANFVFWFAFASSAFTAAIGITAALHVSSEARLPILLAFALGSGIEIALGYIVREMLRRFDQTKK